MYDYDPFYNDPYAYNRHRARPHLGVDNDGDLVEDFGNGLGIDLETGDLELEIFPGLNIEL